jgi:hypothetical protein
VKSAGVSAKILSLTYVKHNSSIPHLATCTYSDGHENVSNQEVISIHPNRYYTSEGLNPGCVSPLQFLRSDESRSAQAPSSDGCAGKANCGGTEPGKKMYPEHSAQCYVAIGRLYLTRLSSFPDDHLSGYSRSRPCT